MKKEISVGGQAVIEGVMMRGPERLATAIRRKNGDIELKLTPFISITQKHKFLGLPIIRGFVSLIEMMKIGLSTLNFSAGRYELDLIAEDEAQGKVNKKKSQWAKKPAKSAAISLPLVWLFCSLGYFLISWRIG